MCNGTGARSYPIFSHKDNHSVATYKSSGIIISFGISRYSEPEAFGELIRRRRLEHELYAEELANIIGVSENTILGWEKGRYRPYREKLALLTEHLDIHPSELIEFNDGFEKIPRTIINYIKESGKITVEECKDLLKVKKQTAQNNLYFLYKLGVLDRTLRKRKKGTYFFAKNDNR